MNRSTCTTALILNIKQTGENNSTVTLLTPEHGIYYATLYGGPKSKMRSLVSLYNSGKIWLYENPEKKQTKISDFEVISYHETFSQNLFKSYAAALAGELAIKTRCAGSPEICFKLVNGFLDGMNLCDEEQSRLGLLRFLWRYLELLGVQPQSHLCGNCGKSFLDSQFTEGAISYYNVFDNSFICSDCMRQFYTEEKVGLQQIPINISAVQYLSAINVLSPAEVRKLHIGKQEYEQIREIVFFLIEDNIEQKLNSIETGMGIL